MKPNKPKLLKRIEASAKTKFKKLHSWKAHEWIIAKYTEQGGKFVESSDTMDQEKQEALDVIGDALKENGFKKIDDNSFVIGNSQLNTKTLANLLYISHGTWYQYVINDPVKLVAKSGELIIKKDDFFSFMDWKTNAAILTTSQLGAKKFRVPIEVAKILIYSSRALSARERRFRPN